MRRIGIVTILLLLWFFSENHCKLNGVFAECDGAVACDVNGITHQDDCSTQCGLSCVTKSRSTLPFEMKGPQATVRIVFLPSILLALSVSEETAAIPTPRLACGEELVRRWQFRTRAAMPPRAPSLV